MNNTKIYIHYGHKKFNKFEFDKTINACWVKPVGGLWASAVDAPFGWKDWNKESEYADCNENNAFKFKLSSNARVLIIDSVDDLKTLPKEKIFCDMVFLDFERIIAMGYDALEVNISKDQRLYWKLYGWDCDSLLVFNPSVVEVI